MDKKFYMKIINVEIFTIIMWVFVYIFELNLEFKILQTFLLYEIPILTYTISDNFKTC